MLSLQKEKIGVEMKTVGVGDGRNWCRCCLQRFVKSVSFQKAIALQEAVSLGVVERITTVSLVSWVTVNNNIIYNS